ncbi:hypothetical protein UPYG_G00005140 [Umbra pygmaea]|uniref:Ribosomal protein S11 n=1 Tax=Umbra pygmaea TaxID=75934 RepID=A0ABD0XJS2_UMBPY
MAGASVMFFRWRKTIKNGCFVKPGPSQTYLFVPNGRVRATDRKRPNSHHWRCSRARCFNHLWVHITEKVPIPPVLSRGQQATVILLTMGTNKQFRNSSDRCGMVKGTYMDPPATRL